MTPPLSMWSYSRGGYKGTRYKRGKTIFYNLVINLHVEQCQTCYPNCMEQADWLLPQYRYIKVYKACDLSVNVKK